MNPKYPSDPDSIAAAMDQLEDPEDAPYLIKAYGSVEEFNRRVAAVKSLIATYGELAADAADLTSDRRPEQIQAWLVEHQKIAGCAIKLYEASGATGPSDQVWSDLDTFAHVWDNL